MKSFTLLILSLQLYSLNSQQCDVVIEEGYLIDNFCWDMPNHIAIDGSDLANEPQVHTRHCLFDIPQCVDNGYGIIVKKEDDGTYDYKYKLNDDDNERIVEYLARSTKKDDFLVTVEGIYCTDDDSFSLVTLADSNGIGIVTNDEHVISNTRGSKSSRAYGAAISSSSNSNVESFYGYGAISGSQMKCLGTFQFIATIASVAMLVS